MKRFRSKTGKTLKRLKEYTKTSKILGEIDFKDPLKNDPEGAKEKVLEWAKEIVT